MEYDFKILEKGDETILVDRGLNLSKGQQARVNLARAVYKDADIYLIDDALTALDTRVQDQIFTECIQGFLKDKLVVLVTHHVKQTQCADQVVVLDYGSVKFDGKQQQLSKDILEALTEDIPEEKPKESEKEEEAGEKTKLLTEKPKIGRKHVYQENNKKGSVEFDIYKSYFKFGGGLFFFIFIIIVYFSATFSDSSSSKMLSNW